MAKRKKNTGRFVGVPLSVWKSDEYANLKPAECKLLDDLNGQYSGHNNGLLSPAFTLMVKRGWATSSLHRAKTGLVNKGFIVVTRQGWKQRGKPTLVAITWNGIDDWPSDKTGQYDDGVKVSGAPLNTWRKPVVNKPCKTKDALLYGIETCLPTPYRRIKAQITPLPVPYRSTN